MTDTENEPAEGTITPEELVPAEETEDSKEVAPNSTEEIVQQVREGKWGSRKLLRENLIAAGYDYKAVMKELQKK